MNTRKLCDGCDECNMKSPLFKLLNEDELKIINGDRCSVRFRPGEIILKQGTQANNIVSVIEGLAKVYIEGFNDRNLILDYVKPWSLIGTPGALVQGKYAYSAVAKTESLVCFLDTRNFSRVLDLNREFSKSYLQICSSNYTRSMERMVSLSQKQMHGRIADALIYLSENIYESDVIGAEITRQDVADYTSMSKDSAIRILKEFERDNIVKLEDKTIVLLDNPRLHSISLNG
jgi:CRP-like cAMP-binding protein